jgi:hypothetical protein
MVAVLPAGIMFSVVIPMGQKAEPHILGGLRSVVVADQNDVQPVLVQDQG